MSAGSSRAAPGAAFEIGPGVVVEGDGTTVFLMRPGGGIEAVDVQSGASLWSTAAAAKPLAVDDGRLLAQNEATRRGVLPLLILDAARAGEHIAVVEIPLPDDIPALIDQHLGVSFSVRARTAGGEVVLAWAYLEQEVSGVAPPPGTPPVQRRVEGAARVDLANATVESLDNEPELPVQPLPPGVQRLVDAGELRPPPWRADGLFVATSVAVAEDGRRIVTLKRWRADTWRALAEVTLFEGTPRAQRPSANRRHLVVASTPAEWSSGWQRYRWSVFSLTDGAFVGDLQWHTSATPFCMFDGVLLMISQPFSRRIDGRMIDQPLSLRAIDVGSGAQIWSRPLRDTTYRGPRPAGR